MGGWAVLSQAIAVQDHLHIGRRLTLPSPHPRNSGCGMTTNLGWPPDAIILNSSGLARAWGSTDPSAYNLMLAARRLDTAGASGGPAGTGGEVGTGGPDRRPARRAPAGSQPPGPLRLTQIATLVLIATVLAMSIAMGTMIWQRRPRFARMKVQGYGHRVLWRALIFESGLLLGAGCSIGAVFGIYGQLLISHALATVTGFPVVFSVGALIAIFDSLLVSVIAVGIVAVPGYRAASVSPYV